MLKHDAENRLPTEFRDNIYARTFNIPRPKSRGPLTIPDNNVPSLAPTAFSEARVNQTFHNTNIEPASVHNWGITGKRNLPHDLQLTNNSNTTRNYPLPFYHNNSVCPEIAQTEPVLHFTNNWPNNPPPLYPNVVRNIENNPPPPYPNVVQNIPNSDVSWISYDADVTNRALAATRRLANPTIHNLQDMRHQNHQLCPDVIPKSLVQNMSSASLEQYHTKVSKRSGQIGSAVPAAGICNPLATGRNSHEGRAVPIYGTNSCKGSDPPVLHKRNPIVHLPELSFGEQADQVMADLGLYTPKCNGTASNEKEDAIHAGPYACGKDVHVNDPLSNLQTINTARVVNNATATFRSEKQTLHPFTSSEKNTKEVTSEVKNAEGVVEIVSSDDKDESALTDESLCCDMKEPQSMLTAVSEQSNNSQTQAMTNSNFNNVTKELADDDDIVELQLFLDDNKSSSKRQTEDQRKEEKCGNQDNKQELRKMQAEDTPSLVLDKCPGSSTCKQGGYKERPANNLYPNEESSGTKTSPAVPKNKVQPLEQVDFHGQTLLQLMTGGKKVFLRRELFAKCFRAESEKKLYGQRFKSVFRAIDALGILYKEVDASERKHAASRLMDLKLIRTLTHQNIAVISTDDAERLYNVCHNTESCSNRSTTYTDIEEQAICCQDTVGNMSPEKETVVGVTPSKRCRAQNKTEEGENEAEPATKKRTVDDTSVTDINTLPTDASVMPDLLMEACSMDKSFTGGVSYEYGGRFRFVVLHRQKYFPIIDVMGRYGENVTKSVGKAVCEQIECSAVVAEFLNKMADVRPKLFTGDKLVNGPFIKKVIQLFKDVT